MLSYIFRCGLNDFLVQFLFSLCVKLEILVFAPFFVTRLVWLSFVFLYYFWLCLAIIHSNMVFLSLSKALLTLVVVYYRLRVSFFNVSILDLPVNQSITLENSFSLLDKSVMLQGNSNFLFSSAFSSKLSRHTNNLNVPFLIQTRGMAARAAAETMTKALSEVVFQNPGLTIVTASGVVTGAIGTVVALSYDSIQRKKERDLQEALAKSQIDSNAEIEKNKIVESQLNRETNRETNYAIMNRNSIETAERTQDSFNNKSWFFRGKEQETILRNRVAYYKSKENEPSTSEPIKIESSQLNKSGLTETASVNEASGLKGPIGSGLVPCPLDQPEYTHVTVRLLQSIYKMLILWF